MKSKLSHPAVIVIISVILSQIASWTLSTVVAGIDEVRSSVDTDEGTLADFAPFYKTVSFFFNPYTKDELEESEPEQFFTDEDIRLTSIEERLHELDGLPSVSQMLEKKKGLLPDKISPGRIDKVEADLEEISDEIKQEKARTDLLYAVSELSFQTKNKKKP